MKKVVTYLLFISISFVLLKPTDAKAQMPARAKAFLTMVGYGVAGGALLGTASLAFGTSTRSVAQGASLGLYAGILFGAYVLFSVHNKKVGGYGDSSYDESSDVYGEDYDATEGGGADGEEGREPQGSFNRFINLQDKFNVQSFSFESQKRKGGNLPPLGLNIINLSF